MHIDFFFGTIKDGRLAAILLRFFMSGAITQKCLDRFHSKSVQLHRPMSYICTSIFLPYNPIWPPGSHFVTIFSCPEPYLRPVSTDFLQRWYKDIDLCHTYARWFFSQYDPKWPPGGHFVTICSCPEPYLRPVSTDFLQSWYKDIDLCHTYAR